MSTLATFDVVFLADTKGFDASVSGMSGNVTKWVGGLGNLALQFVKINLLVDAWQKVTSLAGQSIFGMNAMIETATARFATLTGSVQKAQAQVLSLIQFSAKTPFNAQSIINADRYLQQFGGDALNTQANLKLMTDAAAATGAPIVNIGFQIGRVYAALQGGEPFSRATLALERMGVLTPQAAAKMSELSKAGADSDKIWAVFTTDLGRFADAAVRQQQTWQGLLTTITNFAQLDVARATQPLFDFVKQMAIGLINVLTNPQVSGAIDAFANGLRVALQGLLEIGKGLIPVIQSMISGFISLGKTVIPAVIAAWNQLNTLTNALYKGGIAAIQAYAKGILDGVAAYLNAAVNYVANFISGFLIGQSPPPVGPLSKITVGGQKVIEAWVKGAMSADLSPILAIPKFVSDSLTTVKTAIGAVKDYIASLKLQVDNITRSIDELNFQATKIKASFTAQEQPIKDAMASVNDAMKTQQNAIDAIDRTISHVNYQMSSITRTYDDQINPIQRQIDLLNNALTVQDQLTANSLAMKENTLQQQLIQAQINGQDTTAIQKQIDALDLQVQLNDLQNQAKTLANQQQSIPLQAQEDALKQAEQDALTPLQDQLNILQGQKETMDDQMTTLQGIQAGYQAQLDTLNKAEAAALKPINDQLTALKEQKTTLNDQITAWDKILSSVNAVSAAITSAQKKAKGSSTTKGAGGLAPPPPDISGTNESQKLADKLAAQLRAAAAKAAQGFVNAFVNWLQQNLPTALLGLAGFLEGGPVGAVLGAAFGNLLQNTIFKNIHFNLKSAAGQLGSAVGAVLGFFAGGPVGAVIGAGLGNIGGQLVSQIFTTLGKPGAAQRLGSQARDVYNSIASWVLQVLQAAAAWMSTSGVALLGGGAATIVTAVGAAIGFAFLGPAGGLAGAALGNIVGRWLQGTVLGNVKIDPGSIAGLLGTAIGGIAGFAVAGPVGAAAGAGIGNILANYIAQITPNQIGDAVNNLGQLIGTMLGAAGTWLQQNGPAIEAGANTVASALAGAISKAFGVLADTTVGLGKQVAYFLTTIDWDKVFYTIGDAAGQVGKAIGDAGSNLAHNLVNSFHDALFGGGTGSGKDPGIASVFTDTKNWPKIEKLALVEGQSLGQALVNGVSSFVQGLVSGGAGTPNTGISGAGAGVGGSTTQQGGFFGSVMAGLASIDWTTVQKTATHDAAALALGMINGVVNGLLGKNGLAAQVVDLIIGSRPDSLVSEIHNSAKELLNSLTDAGGWIAGGLINGMISVFNEGAAEFVTGINALVDQVNKSLPGGVFSLGHVTAPHIDPYNPSHVESAGNLPNYDRGGIVTGPLGHPQLAIVHGGEEVRTPEDQAADNAPPLVLHYYAPQNTSPVQLRRDARTMKAYLEEELFRTGEPTLMPKRGAVTGVSR